MKAIICEISSAFRTILKTFFATDQEVLTDEVRQILSDPKDAEEFKKAVKRIDAGEKEVTVPLSGNRELTLVQ